jgi:aminocarboxymuconate-semialdehyde decarboxylase
MKIDAFCHLLPRAYAERLFAIDDSPVARNIQKRVSGVPALVDMDVRFGFMDEFGPDYRQIINSAAPPLEDLGPAKRTTELSRIANDGMAELVADHPDRFAGFCAAVSLDDVDAAITETERAFDQLGAVGVQIYTHFHGGPMDQERFFPFYEAVSKRGNKIIQVHPCRDSSWSDYKTEPRSKFEMWWTLGWEYDLAAFMSRLVFAGIFERLPEIKILMHHGGAMIPHFAGRVGPAGTSSGRAPRRTRRRTSPGTRSPSGPSTTSSTSTSTRLTSAPATRCAPRSSSSAWTTPSSARTRRSTRRRDRATPARRSRTSRTWTSSQMWIGNRSATGMSRG